uniref:Uncharacterized protein n=1 Tax=Aegilops tauschii subsp. strangulata TaxID=200361 RepID=A0A452YPY7_AEGTS
MMQLELPSMQILMSSKCITLLTCLPMSGTELLIVAPAIVLGNLPAVAPALHV